MTLLYSNYRKATPAPNTSSSAIPLVLLHGLLGRGDDWQPLIQSLPGQACLTIDLPGHGNSPFRLHTVPIKPGKRKTINELLEDDDGFVQTAQLIEQVLDQHGISQCHLLGYSLGGRLAQYFACHYPHKVKQLIIESAHPGLTEHSARQQRWQHDYQWAQRFDQEPIRDVLAKWYQQPVFSDLSQPQMQDLIARRCDNRTYDIAAMLLATSLSRQADLSQALRKAAFPVHYLCGGQDKKFSALADSLSKSSNSITKHIFPASGHNIHRFEPLKYNQTLMQLLAAYQ
ncbi:2-succinyl-6-hydroxy-2,4-cyclohexadiene-1-carboxylate synthase [Motilimonas pumila]|uniref:2-succinyl-6-hydroxy-2, 4-cyclohexadiene-1-carboxylate synthase n=1 Tax=Motilimonas pumila TaxID=2303987 RepID=UPI0018E0C447|nr:2-succinyl-6-hydroxy-2,4-cyclohexadiene-1-carboxylate synthase [Motilimonas pumila]